MPTRKAKESGARVRGCGRRSCRGWHFPATDLRVSHLIKNQALSRTAAASLRGRQLSCIKDPLYGVGRQAPLRSNVPRRRLTSRHEADVQLPAVPQYEAVDDTSTCHTALRSSWRCSSKVVRPYWVARASHGHPSAGQISNTGHASITGRKRSHLWVLRILTSRAS